MKLIRTSIFDIQNSIFHCLSLRVSFYSLLLMLRYWQPPMPKIETFSFECSFPIYDENGFESWMNELIIVNLLLSKATNDKNFLLMSVSVEKNSKKTLLSCLRLYREFDGLKSDIKTFASFFSLSLTLFVLWSHWMTKYPRLTSHSSLHQRHDNLIWIWLGELDVLVRLLVRH